MAALKFQTDPNAGVACRDQKLHLPPVNLRAHIDIRVSCNASDIVQFLFTSFTHLNSPTRKTLLTLRSPLRITMPHQVVS